MRHLVHTAFAIALLCAGCGGSQAASDDTTTALDETPPVADEAAPEETTTSGSEEPAAEPAPQEPPATGPGRLRVVNRVGGQDSSGVVRVLNTAGDVVAQGRSGETFILDAGSYRVVGEITDDDVLIDTPVREADGFVQVVAGQEQTATIDHPVSRVRIRVTRRGRPVATWRMEVRRQGDPNAEPIMLRSSNRHIPVTPGRYDATLHVGGQQITVNGIIFQGGATMDVPVNVD